MKTETNFLPDLLTNPVSRNLILILIGTMLTAVTIVTSIFLAIG